MCSMGLCVYPSTTAMASSHSMPNTLKGYWNIRWTDGGLSNSDLQFNSKSVRSGSHTFHLKQVKKTKKNHFRLYFKNAQPITVVYGFRNIGSYSQVKSIGVTAGASSHGFDAMYYKGMLQKYRYKSTQFGSVKNLV